MNSTRKLAIASVCALLAACGGPVVDVSLSSNATLNMNHENKPLPVVVRIYQLSEKSQFENANFSDIWKNDMSVLGDSLLTSKEVIINPSDQERIEVDKHDQAKYVGVVAIFRNPVEKKWRDIHEISTGFWGMRFSSSLSVKLVGNTLKVSN